MSTVTGSEERFSEQQLKYGELQAYQSGTATASSGAATLNAPAGKITSEALTTAASANYTLTLTNSVILATDIVVASVAYGTATTGDPYVGRITPAAGSVVIIVRNAAAATSVNGTLVISFMVLHQTSPNP